MVPSPAPAEATTPEEPAEASSPAKRGPGRPRKSTASVEPAEQAIVEPVEAASPAPAEAIAPAAIEETTPVKRGRGRPKKNSMLVDTPAAKPVKPAAAARQPSADLVEEQVVETVSPGKRGRGRPRKTLKAVDIDVAASPTEEAAPPTPATRAGQARTLPWVRSKRSATSESLTEAQASPLQEEAAATTPEKLSEEPVRVESSEEPAPQTPAAATPTRRGRATDNTPPISGLHTEVVAAEPGSPSRPVRRGRPPGSTKAAKAAALAAAMAAAEAAGLDPSTVLPTPSKRGRGRGRGRGTIRSPLVRGRASHPISFTPPAQPRRPRDEASDEESDEYVAGSAEDDEHEDVLEVANDSYDESDSDTSKRTPRKKQRVNKLANASKNHRAGTYTPVDFSAKRTVKLDRRWGGPQPSDRLDNPYRIDLGLDQATWSVLHAMRVNRDCFEIETDKDMLALAIPTSGNVRVAMLNGSGEPLRSDKAPIKLGPLAVHELIDDTTGWVVNTGLSACSADWAPVRSDSGSDYCVDFVAVGGINMPAGSSCSPATSAVEQCATERVKGAKPGSIQIWRADTASKTAGSCRLSMLLTHTFGRCIMLKWCPVSLAPASETDAAAMSIVGYLAAVFGDGYLRVCAVPHPGNFASSVGGPVCVRWPKFSLVEISAPHGIFTSLAWASSDLLVAGTSSGSVTAWLLGSSIRAQHANWMASKRSDKGPWPYSIPAEFFENEDCQLAPVVNYPVHTGIVCSVDAYCGGPIKGSNEGSLFTQIGLSNIQIISASDIGRIQQTLAAFPSRHHHTIAIMASKPRVAAVFWPTANFLYGDADNCVRITVGNALINPGDPWVYTEFDGHKVGKELANTWNSPTDLSAIYALNLSGAVLDISVSEFHPYIVVSSSDGSVLIQNILGFDNSSRRAPMFRKIYSLLWYPYLKQSTLHDDDDDEDEVVVDSSADVGADDERLVCLGRTPIQPRPMIPRGGSGSGNKAKRDEDDDDDDEGGKRAKGAKANKGPKTISGVFVHPAQTAVQACAWSRNPCSAHWVASVCAVGLLRIEDVSL
ncbi:hypothetical protein GGI17_003689 [Coemansia sp. S146]|nr:hypothetical protein GGI17_003689 [Coemansia sp. S146]